MVGKTNRLGSIDTANGVYWSIGGSEFFVSKVGPEQGIIKKGGDLYYG